MSEPIVVSSEDEGEAIPSFPGEVITISSDEEAFEKPSFTPRSRRRAPARSRSPRISSRRSAKHRARTRVFLDADDPIYISEDEDTSDDRARSVRKADTADSGLSSTRTCASLVVKTEQGATDDQALVNGTSASPPLAVPSTCQSTLKEESDDSCKSESVDRKAAMGNSTSSSGPDAVSGELEDRTVSYHDNQVTCQVEPGLPDPDQGLQEFAQFDMTEDEALRIAIQRSLADSLQNRDSCQESDDDPDLAKAIALSRAEQQQTAQGHGDITEAGVAGPSGVPNCSNTFITSSSQSSSDSAIWEHMTKPKVETPSRHMEDDEDVPMQSLCNPDAPVSPYLNQMKKLSQEEVDADLEVALALSQAEADTQKQLLEEEELILQRVCAESLKDFNRTRGISQQFPSAVASPVLQLPNGTACSPHGNNSSHLPPVPLPLQGGYIGTFSSVCTESVSRTLPDSRKRSLSGYLSDESPAKRVNMTNIECGAKDVSTHKLASRTLASSFKLLEKAKSKSPSKSKSARAGSPGLPTPTKQKGSRGTKVENSPVVNGAHETIRMKDCRVTLTRLTEEEIVRHSPKAKLIKRQRLSDSDSSDWATPRKRHRSGKRKPMVLSDDSDTDIPDGRRNTNVVGNNNPTKSSTSTYACGEAIKKSRCQLSFEDPLSTKEVAVVVSDDHTSSRGQAESEEDSIVVSDDRISSKDMSDDALPDLELISYYCPALKERYSSDDLPDLEIIDAYFPSAGVSVPVIKKEPCNERISDSTRSCAESPVQWRRKSRKVIRPNKLQTFMTDYKVQSDNRGPSKSSKSQSSLRKKKMTFGPLRSNMLNSYEEAEDYDSYLNLIKSFTTPMRVNSPDTTKFIIEGVLLKSRSETIASEAFQVLEHVQNLHPFEVKSDGAKWFWTLLQTLCKNLGLTEESAAPLNAVSFYNNAHALQYLVKLCESDLRRHLRSKSRHHSLVRQFSSDRHYQQVEELLRWTVNSVGLEHRTVPANSCTTPKKKSQSYHRTGRAISFGNVQQANVPSCLQSLQKLLLLVEEASDSPYDCRKMGNELLTSYICLARLRDCRLLLQTMQAHQLRLWFLEGMFYNQCNELYQGLPISLQRITSCFFKCQPRALAEVEEEGEDQMGAVREACEELAMLLFSILQSYTRVKMGQHHSTSSAPRAVTKLLPTTSTSARHSLSTSDLQALEQLPKEVENLRLRLEDLCSPLSKRTHNYLQQMVVLGKSVQQRCKKRD
ncbi:SUMO-interacting motif-containing protein 1 [Branchiostoma belcheri]|nr:SUMO-interacting motif-containing protein 1 [Branchiostoma belcheri]